MPQQKIIAQIFQIIKVKIFFMLLIRQTLKKNMELKYSETKNIKNSICHVDVYKLYEYCIVERKFAYIKKYCEHFITSISMYNAKKYFEYYRKDHIGAVYYCIVIKGMNAEKADIEREFIDAFYIAFERNKLDMLRTLIYVLNVKK